MDMKQMARRIAALLLCLTMLLSCTVSAFADTLAYTNKKATIYVEVNGALKKAGTAPKGTEVTLLDTNGAWARVSRDGKVAYMKLSALTVKPETAPQNNDDVVTCDKYIYTAVDNVIVYEKDDVNSDQLTVLGKGVRQRMVAYTDEWCMVRNGKYYGYVLREQMSLEPVSAATATPAPTATPESQAVTQCRKSIYAAVEGVKVYKSDSTSAKVQDELRLGQKVTMTAYTDTWCQIKAGSKVGYVLREQMSLTPVAAATATPEPTATPTPTPAPTATPGLSGVTQCNKPGYAVEDGVKVYAKADTDSSVIDTLDKNEQVTVTGYNSKWCQVKNGSNYGYVLLEKLSDTEIVDMPTELHFGDTGEAVKKLQTRLKELGYFTGTIGGNYLGQTRTAVMTFQAQNDLEVDGTAGPNTLKKLFSKDAKPYDPSLDTPSSSGGSTTSGPSNALVQEMDWWTSDIQKIFSRGTTATVTDCSTGISWKERRNGGTNHADVQPVTAADTAAMLSAVGSWSWNRRAVWVTIDGKNYAASINCMPHGSGSITDNNFDGHHCIHFTNSRTHGSNKVCSLHQAAIKKALKYNPN